MVKKHLITCFVLLGLLLTTKMFIYSTPETFDNYSNEVKGAKNDGFSLDPYFNTLSFANETLPFQHLLIYQIVHQNFYTH